MLSGTNLAAIGGVFVEVVVVDANQSSLNKGRTKLGQIENKTLHWNESMTLYVCEQRVLVGGLL